MALFAAGYLYLYIDDEVRRGVEQILARHYTHLDVQVESARIVKGQGIEIRGLTIAELRTDRQTEPLVEIDEIFLACQTDVKQLLEGPPKVERMIVRRPTIRATLDSDGQWNVNTLFPPPQLSERPAPTTIQGATVILTDARSDDVKNFILRDIDLDLKPRDEKQSENSPEVNTTIAQSSAEKTNPGRSPLDITGSLASRFAESVTFQGFINPETGQFNLGGKVTRLDINPELLATLPKEEAPIPDAPIPNTSGTPNQEADPTARNVSLPLQFRSALESFQARADLSFRADYNPAVSTKIQYVVDGQIAQGRLTDPRLPHPISDLSANFHVANEMVVINDLQCMCGVTSLKLSGHKVGFRPQDPLSLSIEKIDHLTLNQALFEQADQRMSELWRKYQPTGDISLEGTVSLVNGQIQPDVLITFHNVSLLCDKFPYPVSNTTGTIRRTHDQLSIDLVAHAGGQPIRIHGDWNNPGPTATGGVTISGNNLTVDEKILPALEQLGKAHEVVKSLHPRGTINIFWKAWRDDPNVDKLLKQMVLDIHGGTINYDLFPYPLADIQGRAEWRDDVWTFSNLRGANDEGTVTCDGSLTPLAPGVQRLVLDFQGDNVRLDEDLRKALPPSTHKTWNTLRPTGNINLTANVVYETGKGPPAIGLSVTSDPNTVSASIRPVDFPCRLDHLDGKVTYRDGHAEWKQLRATHNDKIVTMLSGTCDHTPDGRWSLRFHGLEAEQLHIRRDVELIGALPPALREVIVQLDPTGSFNLQGKLALDGAPGAPLTAGWDLALQTFKTDLTCGVDLTNVRGQVRLIGNYDGRRVQCWGELGVDSLNWLDTQFTQVRGPFLYDNDVVYLGNRATRLATQPDRQITGKLFGGTLSGAGSVRLSRVPEYDLVASLQGGDLRRLAQETITGPTQMTGAIAANISVRGAGSSLNSLQGSGQVKITDATIYELPVLVTMLSLLRAEAPQNTAFKRSDMQFQIQGPRLHFNQLDLVGDAISLYGEGEVDFEKKANLTFYSVVGRNDVNLPLLRYVVGSVSQQFMQIRVQGNLNDPNGPRITNELFPLLQEAIQQIQPESPNPNQPQRILGAPARLLNAAGLPSPTKRK